MRWASSAWRGRDRNGPFPARNAGPAAISLKNESLAGLRSQLLDVARGRERAGRRMRPGTPRRDPAEPSGHVPVAIAEQRHHRGQQHDADNPPEPAPYVPSPDSGWRRRSPVRPVMIAALLPSGPSTCPRPPAREPLRPAVSARGPPWGTPATGGSPAVAQPPAITKAEAERVVSRCWQVNNQANESYSDSKLATIEAAAATPWMPAPTGSLSAARHGPVRRLRADRHPVA